jgi:hypothetical protein
MIPREIKFPVVRNVELRNVTLKRAQYALYLRGFKNAPIENEGVGPHTKTTLHHIQELKKKHGIDYDSHASYRFSELEPSE